MTPKYAFVILFSLFLLLAACHGKQADSTTKETIVLQPYSSSPVTIKPSDPLIHYVGRINFENPDKPRFVMPGVTISIDFEGTGVDMMMRPGSKYFMIEVDTMPAFKVCFGPQDSCITLAKNLPRGHHKLRAMLCYEGNETMPQFRGFRLHEGRLLPVQESDLKLEFIGNSVTCGYGIEADNELQPYTDSTQNFYYSYAAITARNVHADALVVALSGAGVYQSYSNSLNTIPQIYDYTITTKGERWDFNRYKPNIIFVGLGANDFSRPLDVSKFHETYRRFLEYVHSKQSQATIVMGSGPTLRGDKRKMHIAVCDSIAGELKAKGIDVRRINFSPVDGSLGYGADWHPSRKRHAVMAQELTPLIREIAQKQKK